MSRARFLARVKWIEGRPEGLCLPEGIGPILYQDSDGDVYALNELEVIPDRIQRHAMIYDQSLAKPQRKTNGHPPTISPKEKDQLFGKFVDAYIDRYPSTKSLPRDKAYRNQRADFIHFSNLINARGREWILDNWQALIDRYFDRERYQGILTLADMCKRADAVLSWRARGGVSVAQARGKQR